jgi:cytoskeleton protein RodZ
VSDGSLTSQASSEGPGVALAKAREAAEITQREVSDALNLPVTTIAAIEQDDRDRLPADVFTRGYIRAYARLLQIDPGPLVAAFGGDTQPQDLSATFAESTAGKRKLNRFSAAGIAEQLPPGLTPVRLLAAVGVLLLLIILAIWTFSGDEPAEPTSDSINPVASSVAPVEVDDSANLPVTDDAAVTTAAEVIPSAAATDLSISAEAQTQAAESDRLDDDSAAEPDPAEVVPTPIVAPTQVQVVTPPGVRRLTPTGDDRLSIEFTEECWVEIKDPVGNLLYGNLGRPGAQLEFVGTPPFRVLLGYAPGALLKYNAEPVALGPHTRNNVASLVLGQ